MTYEVRKVLDIPKPSITDYIAVKKTRETPGIRHTENEAPWIYMPGVKEGLMVWLVTAHRRYSSYGTTAVDTYLEINSKPCVNVYNTDRHSTSAERGQVND